MLGTALSRFRSARSTAPGPLALSREERDVILRLYWGARDHNPVRTQEGMTLYHDLPAWRCKRVELFLADRGIRMPAVGAEGRECLLSMKNTC